MKLIALLFGVTFMMGFIVSLVEKRPKDSLFYALCFTASIIAGWH